MPDNQWVDFKLVKAVVTMQMVLDHYGIKGLKKAGPELKGKCPIHKGANNKNFSVNLDKNAFKCFSQHCGVRGNVLDLVAAMESCNVRDAALKLQDWFKVGESEPNSPAPVAEHAEDTGLVIQRGFYKDQGGAMYEVVIPTATFEDQQTVVYRALFDDFAYFVVDPENFVQTEDSARPIFTLVRQL
jgi:hypothetical protein